jgi:2-polyprenyl-6-methoxyphenol hydroxylase-like FAD-dependent oxidoreductase
MRALIVGGGIGGLAAALSLHELGADVEVYESAGEIRPLGVGINLLPHAVREVYDLGLASRGSTWGCPRSRSLRAWERSALLMSLAYRRGATLWHGGGGRRRTRA